MRHCVTPHWASKRVVHRSSAGRSARWRKIGLRVQARRIQTSLRCELPMPDEKRRPGRPPGRRDSVPRERATDGRHAKNYYHPADAWQPGDEQQGEWPQAELEAMDQKFRLAFLRELRGPPKQR